MVNQETKLLPQAYHRFSRFEYHFAKHSKNFGAIGQDAYYNRAINLMESKVGNEIMGFTNSSGYTFRMNQRTGEFGIMRPNGVIETYYRRINSPIEYWQTQIIKYGK